MTKLYKKENNKPVKQNNKSSEYPKKSETRNIIIHTVLVLLACLAATYLIWNYANTNAQNELRSYFEFRVRDVNERIEQRLANYEQVLRSERGLFNVSDKVNRAEFHTFYNSLLLGTNYPGIQGVGFSLIIPSKQIKEHILSIRAEGFSNYKIWPEGKRETYTSIIYLEPFKDLNLRAFGYDMFSEPVRRKAMEMARDSNETKLSGKITLVQETGKAVQAGFLIYLPVYKKGTPHSNVRERRANITGWVYSPFRMDDFMNGLFGERSDDIDVEIYDGNKISNETKMYESKSDSLNTYHTLTLDKEIDFNGHKWTVIVKSTPELESRIGFNFSIIILIVGIVLSLLIAIITWQIEKKRLLKKIAENELKESDKRFNLAMEASQDGLFDWNLQTNEIYYSPGWKRMLGYDYNELTNDFSIWEKLTDPEDIKRSWEMLQEIKNKKRDRFVMEFKMKHKDGHWVDIISKAKAIFDENDKPVRIIGTHSDITIQKENESMLVKERNRAQQYLDIAGVMLGVLDNNGDIIQMNNKGCKILGYNKEEIINKNWFKLCIDPKRSAEVIEGFHNIINGNLELFEYYENDIITKTGEIKTLAFHNSIIRDEKKNIIGILFSGDDITLRKLAEESLSESEEKFRNLADNSPNMIFINKNGKIVYANKKVEEITGYKIDTLYSDSFDFLVLIEPEYRDMIMDNFYKHLNGEEAQIIDYRIRTLSGKSIDALLNTKLIKYERDTAILGIITDISERKINENKLNTSYLELRKLTERLLHVREEERASVAREIHDDLGQSLTAIKMDVSLLHKHKIIDAETREQKFKILLELINTTIQSVKRIASDLRPGILDDLGLIPAIEWLTEEFEQRYKLKCNLSIISKDVDLEEDVSVAVFRIYQESLTNIARHSKATKIDIHIGFREDRKLYLDIQDNGIGIDYEGLKNNNSYGIIGMKERIGLLNGEIDIIGKPNKGTLIKVVVPY